MLEFFCVFLPVMDIWGGLEDVMIFAFLFLFKLAFVYSNAVMKGWFAVFRGTGADYISTERRSRIGLVA